MSSHYLRNQSYQIILSLIMARMSTWTELCADQDVWKNLNMQSLKVINLLETAQVGCAQKRKDNSSLVAMTLDPISSETILIHHLSQIMDSLLQDTTYLIALSEFRPHASAVLLPSSANFFEHVVHYEVPDPKEMLSAATSKSFFYLKADPLEFGSYHNIVLLPPCLEASIMAAPSFLPSNLAVVVLATSTKIKSAL